MSQIFNLINSATFPVTEGDFVTIGSIWKNVVFFYKYERLYYITDGDAEIFLKDKSIRLKPGYMYFIPSHSVITGNCEESFSHHFIHFRFERSASNVFHALALKNEVKAGEADEYFFKRIERYISEKENGHGNDLQTELEINGIMKILISRFLPDIYPDDSIVPFLDVIEYIDKNIEREITVEELADLCSLNKIYFSNKFAKHMGISPSQFVINRRLEKAMELIKFSNLSMKEIAYKCGFQNNLYFSRIFRKKIGMTPTEFKNKISE
ncbi:MAG: AraC family transcriptional regulator [Candidatus Borkfalkiaceae bacterium]|nr:AraC family transcriptional regulator [Christensenellaceae bacterium]